VEAYGKACGGNFLIEWAWFYVGSQITQKLRRLMAQQGTTM
jgi:hypothetical protein